MKPFTLAEAQTWSADDALLYLKQNVPDGWAISVYGAVVVELRDSEGSIQCTHVGVDPKMVFLDTIGWLRVREHTVKAPRWRPRSSDVGLHRPPRESRYPDPPDLDPTEIAELYKGKI
jgi:hypothetical protein